LIKTQLRLSQRKSKVIQARLYQQQCVDTIWRNFHIKDDQLIALPTASGKTIIFTMLLEKCLKAYPQLKAQVLVNQVKLVTQTQEKLHYALEENHVSLYCGSIGEYDNSAAVTVGSVQSVSRVTQFLNLLIIDEAHNADNSPTYKTYIERLKKANPKLKVVRFTATPFTITGYIYGDDKPNKVIDFRRTMNQMIENKYIVEPVFKSTDEAFDVSKLRSKRGEYIMRDVEKLSLDEKKVAAQVQDAMSKLSKRNKIVWACTCIKHAEIVQREVLKYEDCAIIHSKLNKTQQAENMSKFEEGDCRHMSSVTMVAEGYDYPAIDAIVGMRPTRSPVLYVQLVGRGLRLFPGKENCLFLDYGEIVENLGHPNDPVVIKKARGKQEKQAIVCPQCEELNFLPVAKCRDCGFEFFKEESGPKRFTKNLTDVANDPRFNKDLNLEKELDVLDLSINKNYTSKAGNLCWEVTYITMQGPMKQWFKIGTGFYDNFRRDFNLMGKPKTVIAEKKGRYYRVKEAKWS